MKIIQWHVHPIHILHTAMVQLNWPFSLFVPCHHPTILLYVNFVKVFQNLHRLLCIHCRSATVYSVCNHFSLPCNAGTYTRASTVQFKYPTVLQGMKKKITANYTFTHRQGYRSHIIIEKLSVTKNCFDSQCVPFSCWYPKLRSGTQANNDINSVKDINTASPFIILLTSSHCFQSETI